MRRYQPPFNGKQFLYNSNTNEVHDLDRESPLCKIDLIHLSHIKMFDDKISAVVYQQMIGKRTNSCFYCMPEFHTG